MNGFTWNGSQSALEGLEALRLVFTYQKLDFLFLMLFKAVRGDRPVYRASGGCVGQ